MLLGAAGDGAVGGVDGGGGAGDVIVPGMGDGMGELYPGCGAAGGRIARVMWVMYRLMVPLAVVLLNVVWLTRRVLAFFVMPTVRSLSVMPRVLVPLVMLSLMARVLQGVLRLPLPLVRTTVRVLQVMVLGVTSRMGRRRRCWAWALATPGRGLGRLFWSVGSQVLAVLVASGVWACPRQSWRKVLMVRVV